MKNATPNGNSTNHLNNDQYSKSQSTRKAGLKKQKSGKCYIDEFDEQHVLRALQRGRARLAANMRFVIIITVEVISAASIWGGIFHYTASFSASQLSISDFFQRTMFAPRWIGFGNLPSFIHR